MLFVKGGIFFSIPQNLNLYTYIFFIECVFTFRFNVVLREHTYMRDVNDLARQSLLCSSITPPSLFFFYILRCFQIQEYVRPLPFLPLSLRVPSTPMLSLPLFHFFFLFCLPSLPPDATYNVWPSKHINIFSFLSCPQKPFAQMCTRILPLVPSPLSQ